VSEAQPFTFVVLDDAASGECSGCLVYAPSIRVEYRRAVIDFNGTAHYCRICLKRMRATLKAAEKALPPLPKRVRPTE
jgi:hypothetical protein